MASESGAISVPRDVSGAVKPGKSDGGPAGGSGSVDANSVCKIAHSSPESVRQLLREDSGDFPITKTIVNLLHNIRIVGSIPVTKAQKRYLNNQESVVAFLLNDQHSITKLRSKLVAHPKLVIFIAGITCAQNVASLSQLQDIAN